jgi:LAO/AO transport system kinase
MANAAEDEGVFIRSIATRGALGGLSKAANDVTTILDAAGFDVILVETVGVGQAEVDIVRLADTCVVVMVPGLGDSVQAIKAGVLEIADVFVVNKADRDGADLVQKDLRSMLTLVETPEGAWTPDIIRTVATKGEGRAETIDAVVKHRKWLESSGAGRERQHEIMKEAILQRVQFLAEGKVKEKQHLSKLVDDCLQRKLSPLEAAERLLDS